MAILNFSVYEIQIPFWRGGEGEGGGGGGVNLVQKIKVVSLK